MHHSVGHSVVFHNNPLWWWLWRIFYFHFYLLWNINKTHINYCQKRHLYNLKNQIHKKGLHTVLQLSIQTECVQATLHFCVKCWSKLSYEIMKIHTIWMHIFTLQLLLTKICGFNCVQFLPSVFHRGPPTPRPFIWIDNALTMYCPCWWRTEYCLSLMRLYFSIRLQITNKFLPLKQTLQ